MNREIIIASSNEGKIKEVREILKNFTIIPINELNIGIEIEENETTFEKNAIKKAKTIAQMLGGKVCLADDSGIEIEYLDGFPGVYTKRWKEGTDRQRNQAIIEKLKGIPKEKRKMKFITAISVSDGNKTICKTAILEGYVAEEVRGENGFGFDEIFELKNGKTLAELSQEQKNEISSRRRALENIKNELQYYLQNE